MSKTILVVGATSTIVQALLRLYARNQARFALVGRDSERLEAVANDLSRLGGKVEKICTLDFQAPHTHNQTIKQIFSEIPEIDSAIVGHGLLGDQVAAQRSYSLAEELLFINYLSYISILEPIAEVFENRQRGSIIAFSSVAGDRGRQSNYIYGSTKAGVSCYLQGLRNRLFKTKVKVLTVKPGMVDTPMTADFKKTRLFASPERVAADIFKAERKGRNELYTPWFWRPIMAIICAIPEFLFKRLSL